MPLFNPSAGVTNLIQQTTANGTSGTVTFSSIPQIYRHLRLVSSARCEVAAAGGSINITFNNDSGANYVRQRTEQFNTTVSTATVLAQNSLNIGVPGASAPAGKSSTFEIVIPDYVGGFHKAANVSISLSTSAVAGGFVINTTTGWWLNTAAITRIDLITASGNFTTGSVFSLYGLS